MSNAIDRVGRTSCVDISGERLWIELKRIAEGRHAGPTLKVMLQQQIGTYLGRLRGTTVRFSESDVHSGIPVDANLDALERHWHHCHQSHPHGLTILTTLFRNMDEVRVRVLEPD